MQLRSLCVMSAAMILAATVACQKSQPLSPTAPVAPVVTPADNSTLKVSAPKPASPISDVRIETFTTPTLSAAAATPTENGGGLPYQYHFQLMNSTGAVLQQATVSSTSWTPTVQMDFDTRYTWQVRAEASGAVGPWSPVASFLSPDGGFIRGQQVFDPLYNGKTVASRRVGGHFVSGANGGWQSDGLDNALDYDIPTCKSCRAEFDVTNFGTGEGSSILVDVKWFSMGDAGAWGDFQSFRDHPWKMHLEQRSDGDGTGMQIIWRNGANDNDTGGDPEYGDHRGKYLFNGPDWGHSFDNKVWHFVIEWTPTTYKVQIGELGKALTTWFPGAGSSGYFGGGHAYTPSNHRIELGCAPRNESMIGARYRNFKVNPI